MDAMTRLEIKPIEAVELQSIRTADRDAAGNRLEPFAARGRDEPLRCCLRHAEPGELIALISYAPIKRRSVWREVGPVYIHAGPCGGYAATDKLPPELATGPRVLRTYRVDDSMNYEHNTVVLDDVDLRPIIERLLEEPDVATVHVRTVAPQCYLYAVARAVARPTETPRRSLRTGMRNSVARGGGGAPRTL